MSGQTRWWVRAINPLPGIVWLGWLGRTYRCKLYMAQLSVVRLGFKLLWIVRLQSRDPVERGQHSIPSRTKSMALTRREFVVLGVAARTGSLRSCGPDLIALIPASGNPWNPMNPLVLENSKPGDPSWALTQPVLNGETEGHASAVRANRGEQNSFFRTVARHSYSEDEPYRAYFRFNGLSPLRKL
jgi:hypothetical protein